jgi:hypothetical protein
VAVDNGVVVVSVKAVVLTELVADEVADVVAVDENVLVAVLRTQL